jgi:hypothetical protein
MDWLSFFLKARFLKGLVVSALVVMLIYVLAKSPDVINHLVNPNGSDREEVTLPILAMIGIIILMLALTIMTAIFWFLDVSDKTQAMGLPEGSIRAVIALSLIVLFAILSIYLYTDISNGSTALTIDNLSDAARLQFIQEHPTLKDIQAVPEKNDKNLYKVTYGSESTTRDDFAKQLLVLLGTLMTAITSFYLGAGTATSAAAKTSDDAKQRPTLTGISPASWSIAQGSTLKLQVLGNNLNAITRAKIVRAGVEIAAAHVASNAAQVLCEIPVGATTTPPGAPWDVVVEDGSSQSATLPGVLSITA